MENASKALIIAGAILISILLISIGVLVINATNKATEGVAGKASAMEIQNFNATFVNYEGEVTASQAKTLISEVNASNAANKVSTEGEVKFIKFATTDGKAPTISNSKRYTVTLGYDSNTGYVNSVDIKAVSTGTGTGGTVH